MSDQHEIFMPEVVDINPETYLEEEEYDYPSTPEQKQLIEAIPKKGLSDKVIGLKIVHDTYNKGGKTSYYYDPAIMRIVAVTEKGYEVRIPKIRGIGNGGGPRKCARLIYDFFKPLIGQEISFYKQNQYHRDYFGGEGYYQTQVKVRVKTLPEEMRGISDIRKITSVRTK